MTRLLDQEVVPNLSGSRQFYGRVAANVLRIVMRELEHAEDQASRRVAAPGRAAVEPPSDRPGRRRCKTLIWQRTAELCARIRNGEADRGPYREQVLAHLRQTTHDKLVISNPKWITRPVEEEVMAADTCTIRSLRARAVEVPMPRPLLTGGGQVSIAPLVLLDLETHQGITGRSYIFGYTPLTLKSLVALLDELETLIVNQPVSPLTLAEQLPAALSAARHPGLGRYGHGRG